MNKYLVLKEFVGNVVSIQHPNGRDVKFNPGEHVFGNVKDDVLILKNTRISGVKGKLHREN